MSRNAEDRASRHAREPLNIWIFAAFSLIAHFFFNKSVSNATKNDASKVRHLLRSPHKNSLFSPFPRAMLPVARPGALLIRYSSRLQALMAAKVPGEGKRVQLGGGTAYLFS